MQFPEKVHLGGSTGPKFTNFFAPTVGGVVLDHLLFRFSFLLIRSGDICDQSRKLSEQKARRIVDAPPPKF